MMKPNCKCGEKSNILLFAANLHVVTVHLGIFFHP